MRLYLVRHGQTEWNITDKAQGHQDVPLDQVGLEQARLLAPKLQGLGIERILSSDLSRCVATIEPFALDSGIKVEKRRDLRERTFGDMEGARYSELHGWLRGEASRLALPDWKVRPPNGESMSEVWHRLQPLARELKQETRICLVVSHGGALAQLLGIMLRGTMETPRAFRLNNCSLTTLNRRPDGAYWLTSVNDTDHLVNLAENS